MKLNSYQVYLRGIKKLFRKEDSRFLLTTGLKFSLVFLFVTAFLVYILWIMISLNNIFFEAHGYMGIDDFRSAYLNFVTSSLWDSINFVLGFFILLFILGVYIGTILIRPFKTIGEYAAVATEDGSAEFNPEPFSDFRVLNRFSDFFFRYLKDVERNKKLSSNTIPSTFSRIHQPVFDKIFFLHFSMLISIIFILVGAFISFSTVEIQSKIVSLAISSFKSSNLEVKHFLSNQNHIFESLMFTSLALTGVIYTAMAFHFYAKVSGAAFGFFATMRSFMKGNYHARVHLVEYRHVRPYGRMLNKYLDYIQKNYS
jgi:hypothetical protein